MNRSFTLSAIFLGAMLLLSLPIKAQQASKPDKRFALRLNTLGLLSISEMLELEYSISRRVAVFAGSGVGKEPVVNPFGFYLHRDYSNIFCKETGWSAYTGVRVGIPIWKLKGLSVKGVIAIGHEKYMNLVPGSMGCTTAFDIPEFPDMYYYNYVASYACLAYAQSFAKHFFVEPLVGFGPVRVTRFWNIKSHYMNFYPAFQLNLGVRF